ncbi:MAG: TlpA family protein disulfide reductase [Anaerolineae bacterium]|nr:TlpA family protein disulfide reductase [Anaerolineae bacterium]
MERFRGLFLLAGGLCVGLIIGGIVLFSFPNSQSPTRNTPPTTGSPAANFQLEDLQQNKVSLEDFKGQPVVLNFWATWCPPCREEMPLLQATSQRLSGEAHFIGVDYYEDRATVAEFVAQNGITFPILLDFNGKVSDLYYVQSYPMTFFIDSEGVLRAMHIGQLDESLMTKYLKTVGLTQ